ncbi:hypothetical protein C8F01DRAFT_1376775 [Mycena amicta]|nr:hypothetical protein C8F01DRAFT_1376775 [Mycena amicta]
MKQLVRRVMKRLRKARPIPSLPPNVLANIYLQCLPDVDHLVFPDPRTAPLLIAQINREWRQTALQTPQLWTDINITRDTDAGIELMRLWSTRAGDLPVTYRLLSSNATRARQLLEIAVAYHRQWKSATFILPARGFDILGSQQLGPLPYLEHLELQLSVASQQSPAIIPLNTASKLTRLSLAAAKTTPVASFPLSAVDVPWAQLRELSCELHQASWAEGIMRIAQCTKLLALTIRATRIEQQPVAAVIGTVVTMAQLQIMRLDDHVALAELIDYLTLPVLRTLSLVIYGNQHDFTRFNSFVLRSGLIHLNTLFLAVQNPTFLRQLLALLPSIRNLKLELISAGPNPHALAAIGRALQPEEKNSITRSVLLPALENLEVVYPLPSGRAQIGLEEHFVGSLVERCLHKHTSRLVSLTVRLSGVSNHLDATPYARLVMVGVQVTVVG